jgi:signal transduction histidine kinase
MAGICMDATDRKLAEEELANYRDRLEQLVAERTAELEQTHQRLRINERMAGLGTLSAGLGHDMGNLLLPIRARIDVLLAQDLSAAVVEHLKAIRQCADYLQSLTHGLRLLSLDPNEEEDHDPVLRLDKWWSTVEGLMRNALPRRVTLEARGFESAPPLAIAPHKLTQAVFNVIKNAGDALAGASDGRVVVNAEVGDARWKTATEDSSDVAFLSIRDNGPGMPPDVRRRALEPFFTTKKRGLSTGLGLSLVNGIVTSVGGRIDIHAEPGQGTTVKLMLPIAARGMQSAAHAAGAMPPPGKLRAIISLDDQRQTSMLMQMLATAGFEVQSKPDHVAANIVSNGSLQHVQRSDTSLWVVQGRQEFRAAVQAFLNLSRAGRQSANGDHQIEPSQASSGPTPRVVLVLGAADQEWDESGVIALGGPFQLDRVRDAIQLAKAMLQGPHAPTAIGVSTASRSPHECAATQ